MILITGATGKLGSQVIQTLLTKNVPANHIVALVRDETKAGYLKENGIHIRIGDYDDRPALEQAMIGIDKVLLVSGLDASKVVRQHQNVVDAAKQAGVKCLAYTSNSLRDRHTLLNQVMITHVQTEDYIIASGLNYLIFRNVLYMDSMALFMIGGKNVLETGIHLPTGEGQVAYALRSDEAEAIGNVLAGENCSNRIYTFTGSQAYSFADVADALSELSDKPVTYTPVDMDTYQARARERGVPTHAVAMMAPFMTDIKNGQASIISSDLEEALGRKPVDLKAGLKQLLDL
ncbi:SDR family oxidoreductase [Spirosoma rhododendri]|uniref:SDR family oxidoreductase n=1 Tax=Spirosoma rhododendri TaxID=2728024 RepID=A0A7L5DW23_9BACT|nr:SDR family oxidoreductase [Spirosoma rhododendri]QJD81651.1 SDR family oxidoreductase [Spirosoma rhododendri]